jgi:hypothetical protein
MPRSTLDPDVNRRGWPRPFITFPESRHTETFRPERLPVPWLNWRPALTEGVWTKWDPEALDALADDYGLCGVCGEPLGHTKLLGVLGGESTVVSTGTALHPQCALLAYKTCPALLDLGEDHAFYVYHGDGPGVVRNPDEDRVSIDISMIAMHDAARPITLTEIRALAKTGAASAGSCPFHKSAEPVSACPAS